LKNHLGSKVIFCLFHLQMTSYNHMTSYNS